MSNFVWRNGYEMKPSPSTDPAGAEPKQVWHVSLTKLILQIGKRNKQVLHEYRFGMSSLPTLEGSVMDWKAQ